MAKSKQNGGLGKGLDSLFASTASAPSAPAPQAEPEKPAAPAPEAVVPVSEPVPEQPAAAPERPIQEHKPVEPEPAPRKREEIDIIFSEDDLENARVVDREPRKSTVRTERDKKKKPTRRRPDSPRTSASTTAARTTVSPAPQKSVSAAAPTASAPVASQSAAEAPRKRVTVDAPAPEMAPKEKTVLDTKGSVGEIPISALHPNPNQPRTRFKKEDLEELAASIKRDGLLQPILVRKSKDGYEIIAGERRYQACLMVGMETVPVRFWLADEDKALELALIENIQRSDLNPIEEAYGYKRLMERKGMTQSEVAQTVSKGRSTIANALRLLDLPEEAQELLFEEKITAGHARAILAVATQEGRDSLTKKLREENLSVRETETLARLLNGRQAAEESRKNRQPAPASFRKAGRRLTRILHTPVRVKTVKGKNKIEIHFADEDQLQLLLNALVKVKVEVPTEEPTE